MSASTEIQKAIVAQLKAAHLAGGVSVFDHVPDQEAHPFVQVGDMTETPWDTDDTLGREATVTVHTWSRYNGMKQLKELMEINKAALHNVDFAVTGQTLVLCFIEFSESMLDPDGRTRHGVQRFRLITEGD